MQIKLPTTLALLLVALFCNTLSAQKAAKREAGFQVFGFDSGFSGFYKKEIRENVYRRFRLFSGSLNAQFNEDASTTNFFIGGFIGREKRKSLDERLEFYRGPEFSAGLGYQHQEVNSDDNSRFFVLAGIGYVLGLQHSFNDKWAVQIETIPTVRFRYDIANEIADNFGVDINASSSVSLGVARKF